MRVIAGSAFSASSRRILEEKLIGNVNLLCMLEPVKNRTVVLVDDVLSSISFKPC